MSSNFVECNDEGVHYIEARVNCLLTDFLKQATISEITMKLIPIEAFESGEATTGRVLLVKVSFFECGGIAIRVSVSHKIADAPTIFTFIKIWAANAMALEAEEEVILPELINYSSLFPPMNLPSVAIEMEPGGSKVSFQGFVFEASKISMLKAKAGSAGVPQPTRVEAVAALIWKCAIAAATSNRGGVTKPSALVQLVNFRQRMNAPLPEYSVGNLVSLIFAQTQEYSETVQLQGLVQLLRNGITEFSENHLRKLQSSLAASEILETVEAFGTWLKKMQMQKQKLTCICAPVCAGPNIFEGSDFGWGRPCG